MQTEKVTRRNLTEVVVANGKIQPVIQVPISAEVSGEITELAVKEGQAVHKGDLLRKIKPDLLHGRAQSKQGVSRIVAQRRGYGAGELGKGGSRLQAQQGTLRPQTDASEADYIGFKTSRDIAKAQLNSSVHQVEMAQASVASADEQLAKTTISSPLDVARYAG